MDEQPSGSGAIDAARLLRLAYELADAGRPADAEGAFHAAAAASPRWSVPWYELGLLSKYQHRWAESLEHNRRAAELDPSDEAAWWNLGIAATALGDWSEARRAWIACGIDLPERDGAPEMDLGLVPVRLDPDGAAEVVWARRIDPARARIESVPLPSARFGWRDLVLHDGAAEGHRMLHGSRVPVFNVLERIEASPFTTFVLELVSADDQAVDRLSEIADALGGAAEHWRVSTRLLCRECSLGTPHEHDDAPATPAHPNCGLAARDATHAERILEDWLAACPAVVIARWQPATTIHQGD